MCGRQREHIWESKHKADRGSETSLKEKARTNLSSEIFRSLWHAKREPSEYYHKPSVSWNVEVLLLRKGHQAKTGPRGSGVGGGMCKGWPVSLGH